MINKDWQKVCSNYLGKIYNKYLKSKRVVYKTNNCLHIIKRSQIPETKTFYTDASKMGMAGYKSDKISKVIKSPYTSVQKSELYATLWYY